MQLRVRFHLAAISAAALLLTTGCAGMQLRPDPIPVEEVVAMSEAGEATEVILSRVRESRTVYVLRAAEVKELLDQGVPEEVVDYMLETRLVDLERRLRRTYDFTFHHHGPLFPYYLRCR